MSALPARNGSGTTNFSRPFSIDSERTSDFSVIQTTRAETGASVALKSAKVTPPNVAPAAPLPMTVASRL